MDETLMQSQVNIGHSGYRNHKVLTLTRVTETTRESETAGKADKSLSQVVQLRRVD
jgi:hypothetical protein